MLAGLDKINWSQLRHAFGSASDVPDWIRALLSDNKKIRENSIYKLSENLLHQNTVSEASDYAIPFLIELLEAPATPDKADIAMLLADMGNNSGSARYEFVAREGRASKRNPKKGNEYAETIRLSIREELHLLYLYLLHELYYVRAVIAHALQAFPEMSQEIIPLLEKALNAESDKDTKDTIEDSIRILSNSNTRNHL